MAFFLAYAKDGLPDTAMDLLPENPDGYSAFFTTTPRAASKKHLMKLSECDEDTGIG